MENYFEWSCFVTRIECHLATLNCMRHASSNLANILQSPWSVCGSSDPNVSV